VLTCTYLHLLSVMYRTMNEIFSSFDHFTVHSVKLGECLYWAVDPGSPCFYSQFRRKSVSFSAPSLVSDHNVQWRKPTCRATFSMGVAGASQMPPNSTLWKMLSQGGWRTISTNPGHWSGFERKWSHGLTSRATELVSILHTTVVTLVATHSSNYY